VIAASGLALNAVTPLSLQPAKAMSREQVMNARIDGTFWWVFGVFVSLAHIHGLNRAKTVALLKWRLHSRTPQYLL
jgi:hypothetical protein